MNDQLYFTSLYVHYTHMQTYKSESGDSYFIYCRHYETLLIFAYVNNFSHCCRHFGNILIVDYFGAFTLSCWIV